MTLCIFPITVLPDVIEQARPEVKKNSRLLTYLRSSMTEQRLNNCILLHVHMDVVDSINLAGLRTPPTPRKPVHVDETNNYNQDFSQGSGSAHGRGAARGEGGPWRGSFPGTAQELRGGPGDFARKMVLINIFQLEVENISVEEVIQEEHKKRTTLLAVRATGDSSKVYVIIQGQPIAECPGCWRGVVFIEHHVVKKHNMNQMDLSPAFKRQYKKYIEFKECLDTEDIEME
ncbi:hypothetical protein Bbelb_334610 [Branchiostoma belcheri]|nr:hypothetical protein Bbelb_334610 [Branchiostoma belcheri]